MNNELLIGQFSKSLEKISGGKPGVAVLVDLSGALVQVVSFCGDPNAEAVSSTIKKGILLSQKVIDKERSIYLEKDPNKKHSFSQGHLVLDGDDKIGAWTFYAYEGPTSEMVQEVECQVAGENGLWYQPVGLIWKVAKDADGLSDIFIRRLKDNSITKMQSIMDLILLEIRHEEKLVIFTHSYRLNNVIQEIADLIEDPDLEKRRII